MINKKIYKVTFLDTNCTYLVDSETGKSAVLDPGGRSDELVEQIKSDGGKLEYVLITHGHYDHILFAKQLADMFGAKIVAGERTNEFLLSPQLNLTEKHGIPYTPFSADIQLNDGDTFMLGKTEIKYITTPGHTTGCGTYIFDDTMLCGDTLFCESYGRTDLPTGSDEHMIMSLKKLKELDGDYRVIPGHGELTTLSHERKYNPLMSLL